MYKFGFYIYGVIPQTHQRVYLQDPKLIIQESGIRLKYENTIAHHVYNKHYDPSVLPVAGYFLKTTIFLFAKPREYEKLLTYTQEDE